MESQIKNKLNKVKESISNREKAVLEAYELVQMCEARLQRAEKDYLASLRVLRKIAGSPTIQVSDGKLVQIRVRDGKPFICDLDPTKHDKAA
tara:strand:- start:268325 stop:268600 length:276 start_codon:yes stop_codon:yes gene_type:complete